MSSSGDFLHDHLALFEALFRALDRQAQWEEGPEHAYEYMLARWLGGEHGASADKDTFSDEHRNQALPILRQLGVVEERIPSRPRYDEVVVLGAAGIGIHRRIELVRRHRVVAPLLTVLTGLRPHEGHPRDGDLGELLAFDGRFAAAPGWTPPEDLAHQASVLAEAGVSPMVAARALVPSEFALALLLLPKHWPDLEPQSVSFCSGTEREMGAANELGRRVQLAHVFRSVAADLQVRVINGHSVERPAGGPRPTTASTLEDWLAFDDGPQRGTSVLFVANQPHTARVERVIHDVLASASRDDIEIDICGTAAAPDSSILLLLGELPARIAGSRRGQGAA